jgi:hypothetical protein
MDDLIVHDRMRCERRVVGLRQSVSGEVADQGIDEFTRVLGDDDALRQFAPSIDEYVDGDAEDVLRDEAVPAPHREERRFGVESGVAGDVDARVAGADDERPPAFELRGIAERARVPQLTGERLLAGIAREIGGPGDAVGADEVGIRPALAVAERDVPCPSTSSARCTPTPSVAFSYSPYVVANARM